MSQRNMNLSFRLLVIGLLLCIGTGYDIDRTVSLDEQPGDSAFSVNAGDSRSDSVDRRDTQTQPRKPTIGLVATGPDEAGAAPEATSALAMNNALFSGFGSADFRSTSSTARLNFNTGVAANEGVRARKASAVEIELPVSVEPEFVITKSSGLGSFLGPAGEVKAEREKPIVKDPYEIEQHISNTLSRSLQTLTDCYNARLKDDPSVQGTWRISFIVTRDGKTKDPAAQGISIADEELETCMEDKIMNWSFLRLPADKSVSKSITFTPS